MTLPKLGRPDMIALATVAVIVFVLGWIAPRGFDVPVRRSEGATVEGTVLRVVQDRTDTSPQGVVNLRTLEVQIDGRTVTVEESTTPGDVRLVPPQPGDRVLLLENPSPAGTQYYIVDHVRSRLLWVIIAAFAALVLSVGRWYGVRALLGLAATYVILIRFVLPGILAGHSPLVIAVVGGLGIMASTLTLAHGADRKSWAAVGGTALALLVIVVLSHIAIAAAKFTGLADENAGQVFALFGSTIDARGLLLSGILIGALGALDDVTMTQASLVFELHDANGDLRAFDLYRRGMRVGRDHIASIVNTLVLAYAGASLPLLLILASQTESVGTLMNREFLATEVVRTVIGSIGIVAAVPLTTALAAFAAARAPAHDGPDEGAPPQPRSPSYAPIESLDELDLLHDLRPARPSMGD